MLTQERALELFKYVDGYLIRNVPVSNTKAGDKFGRLHKTGYIVGSVDNKDYRIHRIIWLLHNGTLPQFLDHIDGDRTNNRIENLRPATLSQNGGNRSKIGNTTSHWKGVYFDKHTQKYRAVIQANNKNVKIGWFLDAQDAALAYNFAAYHTYGEFAKYNIA
jgi:hypothetical protein